MKIKYLMCAFLFCGLAGLWGCDSEDDIVPSELVTPTSKFEFPQGNTPADAKLADIYDRVGVKVIYKDFTENDWIRSWTPPTPFGSNYRWDFVTGSRIDDAVDILYDVVFANIPDDISRKVLQKTPYMYLTGDMVNAQSNIRIFMLSLSALDSRTVSVHAGTTSDYTTRIFGPVRILVALLSEALDRGLITLPDGFMDDVDFTTPTVTGVAAADPAKYPNFWARRGFCPKTNTSTGRISASDATQTNYPSSYKTSREMFVYYAHYLALEPNLDSRFLPGGLYEDCPLLRSKIDTFLNHMKTNYGIDLRALNSKLFTGFTGNLSVDRLWTLSDDPNDLSYIYLSM